MIHAPAAIRRAGAMLLAAVLAAGCGTAHTGRSAAPTGAAAGSAATHYPVTVTSCGQQVRFDQAPTRAVTNDINTFEDMAALGLEPHLVGDFGLDGYGPDGATAVPAAYQAAFDQVRQVSPHYVTLEPLIGLHPDFLFAGWNYGLTVGSALTPDNLARYGIKTLVLAESCAHVEPGKPSVRIEDTYTDLANLGAIFDVSDRATALIDSMKAQIADVRARIAGVAPKKLFVYDSGTAAPFTAPGLAMPDALIRLAGATNVFHDLAQTWTSVSWEQVIAADPDCIIVNDYASPTYRQKVRFLQTSPVTRNLRAVRAGCFIRLGYGALTPSPLNADAVHTIAAALYPDRMG